MSRADCSAEAIELDTKDFLRHDLAHLVESVLRIDDGGLGECRGGWPFSGDGLDLPGVPQEERSPVRCRP